jgi:hypothetical protein
MNASYTQREMCHVVSCCVAREAYMNAFYTQREISAFIEQLHVGPVFICELLAVWCKSSVSAPR